MADKPSLSIRLTEPVVFLRGSADATVNGRRRMRRGPPALVRGLLTLNLPKPMRITSIEAQLVGISRTEWPEGITGAGSRRIDIMDEHKILSANATYFQATPSTPRRSASIGPGLHSLVEMTRNEDSWRDIPVISESDAGPPPSRGRARHRRMSADEAVLHADFQEPTWDTRPPSIPSSPPVQPPTHYLDPPSTPDLSPLPSRIDDRPSQVLHDSREALRLELEATQTPPHERSLNPLDSLSRQTSRSRSSARSPLPSLSRRRSSTDGGHDQGGRAHSPPASTPSMDPSGHGMQPRHSRFSIPSVVAAFQEVKEMVRRPKMHQPEVRYYGRGGAGSRDRSAEKERGRSIVKEPTTLEKINDVLGIERDEHHNWKEFKKGSYNYPIFFTIPNTVPPSLDCPFGSIAYTLKGYVHRPGHFTPKISTSVDVKVVASPGEDETEEPEDIIVERVYDNQAEYLVCISGRTFPVGGVIPLSCTLLPLDKIKLYRITATLDERIEYFAQNRRISRTDPTNHFELLSVRSNDKGKHGTSLAPLLGGDPDAALSSPLFPLVEGETDSDKAAALMNPLGPWAFHIDLPVPSALHFTNKHLRSNISVDHHLKVTMRIERGDDKYIDGKTKKRKLFDIIVETPIHILSCCCNPDRINLPEYEVAIHQDGTDGSWSCSCPRRDVPQANHSNHPTPPEIGSPRLVEVAPLVDTPLHRSRQFARLVSGEESEGGERPPAYVA